MHIMNSKASFVLLLAFSFTAPVFPAELTGKVSAAVGGRGLAGAIVYVVSGLPQTVAPSPREAPKLTVRAARLDPQVFVVQAGESFTISNADAAIYNVHVRFRESPVRNVALARGGQNVIKTERPELFAVVMEDLERLHGYVCVLEHPVYALTDATGAFKLSDLPDGTYTIEAAHPREGRIKREITVGNTSAAADFELPGRPKARTP
jgi:hypothetical protein